MSTIKEILANKHKYSLDNIVIDTIKTYHIPNTHHNNIFIKQKLQDIIKGHGLSVNDSSLFDEIQKGTFIREIKPTIEKHDWAYSSHNSAVIYKIKHLGNNLSHRYYSAPDLVDYIVHEIDLPNDDQTIAPIQKQLQRILNAYQVGPWRISTGMAYSVIDAMKQFLRNHNDVKIKPLKKYGFADVLAQLATENHLAHTQSFRADLVAENQRRFAHLQKGRYMSGTKDHPSYFTVEEVEKLKQWAHNYKPSKVDTQTPKATVKTATTKAKKIVSKTVTTTKRQYQHRYHTIPLDATVNIDELYTKKAICDYLIKTNNLVDNGFTRKRLDSKLDRLIRKAITTGAVKDYPYKANNRFHKCYYSQAMFDYIVRYINLVTEAKNPVVEVKPADTDLEEILDQFGVDNDMSNSNDEEITPIDVTDDDEEMPSINTTNDDEITPISTTNTESTSSMANNPATVSRPALWNTEDTSILTANPFSIDDQIKVLTKRFLLDQYEIDLSSWKADQDALKALDYHTEAYANLYMRLLHPEINYVTKK